MILGNNKVDSCAKSLFINGKVIPSYWIGEISIKYFETNNEYLKLIESLVDSKMSPSIIHLGDVDYPDIVADVTANYHLLDNWADRFYKVFKYLNHNKYVSWYVPTIEKVDEESEQFIDIILDFISKVKEKFLLSNIPVIDLVSENYRNRKYHPSYWPDAVVDNGIYQIEFKNTSKGSNSSETKENLKTQIGLLTKNLSVRFNSNDFELSIQGDLSANERIINKGKDWIGTFLEEINFNSNIDKRCGIPQFWLGLLLHDIHPMFSLYQYQFATKNTLEFSVPVSTIHPYVTYLDTNIANSQLFRTLFWKEILAPIKFKNWEDQISFIDEIEHFLYQDKEIFWVSELLCLLYIKTNSLKLKNLCDQNLYKWPNHSLFYLGLAHFYLKENNLKLTYEFISKSKMLTSSPIALITSDKRLIPGFPKSIFPICWQEIHGISSYIGNHDGFPHKQNPLDISELHLKYKGRSVVIVGNGNIEQSEFDHYKDYIWIFLSEDNLQITKCGIKADFKLDHSVEEKLIRITEEKSNSKNIYSLSFEESNSEFNLNEKINLSSSIPEWNENSLNIGILLSIHMGASEVRIVGVDDVLKPNHNDWSENKVNYPLINQLHEIQEYCSIHKINIFNIDLTYNFKMFPHQNSQIKSLKSSISTNQNGCEERTITDVIESWVIKDREAECISLLEGTQWKKYSRGQFWSKVEFYTNMFSSHLVTNSFVLFVKQLDIDLLSAYIGAIKAGLQPAQLSPKTSKVSSEEYHRKINHILRVTKADCIFTDEESLLNQSHPGVKILTPNSELGNLSHPITYSDIALAQFSSGSTGLQKAVFLKHSGIISHMDTYAEQINITPEDRLVSWLPLYHDMGLIACYLLPLMKGFPVMMMDAFQWLVKPQILIDTISETKATLCYLPNFAYHVLINKCEEKNLSSMRAFVNCSEPAKPETHELFQKKFTTVHPGALSVCYALAENTYAVSHTDLSQKPNEITLNNVRLISCGKIMENTKVRIYNPDEQGVGEVLIQGSCTFDRFLDNTETLIDGYYPTGDLGLIVKEELYITGRKKDLIIVNGKNIYPQDVEFVASSVPGIYPGRVVCFGIENKLTGTEDLVVQVEPLSDSDTNTLILKVRQQIELEIGLLPKVVEVVPYMSLVKTSSGKISRSRNKEYYLSRGHSC